jgi:hypothetical protein
VSLETLRVAFDAVLEKPLPPHDSWVVGFKVFGHLAGIRDELESRLGIKVTASQWIPHNGIAYLFHKDEWVGRIYFEGWEEPGYWKDVEGLEDGP